jgi:hypothetical protein
MPRKPRSIFRHTVDEKLLRSLLNDPKFSPEVKQHIMLRSRMAPPGPRRCLLCKGPGTEAMLWVAKEAQYIGVAFDRRWVRSYFLFKRCYQNYTQADIDTHFLPSKETAKERPHG